MKYSQSAATVMWRPTVTVTIIAGWLPTYRAVGSVDGPNQVAGTP